MNKGFTVIEIMIAVAITAFGFAAIFSLQIGSMQGNISSRDLASGTNLAERYAEVLRRDALMWTNGPAQTTVYPANRNQGQGGQLATNYLTKAQGQWHSMTAFPVDHNGEPFVDDDAQNGSQLARQRFCVHYRLDALAGNYDGVMAARVRAIWPRAALDSSALVADDICGTPAAFDGDPDKVSKWFSVTVPATLRRHPQ